MPAMPCLSPERKKDWHPPDSIVTVYVEIYCYLRRAIMDQMNGLSRSTFFSYMANQIPMEIPYKQNSRMNNVSPTSVAHHKASDIGCNA